MRRAILSVLSMSVVALLMAQPTVAANSTVYVEDRVGDTNHLLWNTWQGSSGLAEADCLDVTASWMTLRNEKLTAGIEVVAPIYFEDGLPQGVKRIWYNWFFYIETGPGAYHNDYGLTVSWDGDTFYAFAWSQDTETGQREVMEYLNKSMRIHDNVVEVDLDTSLFPGVTAWFFEVIVWMIVPEDDEYCDPTKWYWYFIDITDGTLGSLPFQPMPS